MLEAVMVLFLPLPGEESLHSVSSAIPVLCSLPSHLFSSAFCCLYYVCIYIERK